MYGADGVDYQAEAEQDSRGSRQLGLGAMPVCMAKTHLSLSHDPDTAEPPAGVPAAGPQRVPSARSGVRRRAVRRHQRMPGLGRTPAFMNVDVDDDGRTVGLF